LRPSATGIIAASAAAAIYGTVPVMTRAAYNAGFPALETVAFRTFCVATILCSIAVLRRGGLPFPAQAVPAFLVQAAATFAVSACYLASVQFIPVGLAVIVFFTFPVLIGLAAPLVERRPPDGVRIIGSLVAFAGLALAVGPAVSSVNPLGLALAALASLGCAVQFFSGRALAQYMTPAAFGGLVHLVILPFVVAVMLYAGSGQLASPAQFHRPESNIGLLAFAGVAGAYLGGYFLHMTSVRLAPSSSVAPYFNIEPVMTTLLATVLLGERLSLPQYAGGALVLAAILAISFAGEKKA
jgi:drug/metabolite transporter (DMT)-like permease